MNRTIAIIGSLALAFGMQAQTLTEWANKGDAFMEKGEYQQAIECYLKAQELDTEDTDFMSALQLALAYTELGDSEKAGDAYKASLIKGNYDQGCITSMKKAYEAAGKAEKIKQGYLEIREALPEQRINMDKRLYTIYAKEKDHANALACVKEVLADPDLEQETGLKYSKYAAQLFLNLNEPDSAELYYNKILAITPDDPDVHKAMGYDFYNNIQNTIAKAQATYNAKKGDAKNASHYYAEMQTTTKRVTLNYGPKAIEHLKIANESLNDPNIAGIIAKLQNNIAAYKK